MISELTFIRLYNTFWQLLFPGGDDYVRILNATIIRDHKNEINLEDLPKRRALVNSVAFELFNLEKTSLLSSGQSVIRNITINSDLLNTLVKSQIKLLSRLRYHNKLSAEITNNEFLAIKTLAKRIFKQYALKSDLLIAPKFKGCGILFEAHGDIHYSNTLVEVKSGQRSFSIQDLRQLYVYAALNHIQKPLKINSLELFNPRRGLYWNEDIDVVSDQIAGMPTIEILNEIIYFISTERISN